MFTQKIHRKEQEEKKIVLNPKVLLTRESKATYHKHFDIPIPNASDFYSTKLKDLQSFKYDKARVLTLREKKCWHICTFST